MTDRYLPTLDELRALLSYDPETGDLTWREDRSSRVRAGDLAGSLTPHGVRVTINRHSFSAAHIVAALHTGRWLLDTHNARTIGDPNDLRVSNITMEPKGFGGDEGLSDVAYRKRALNRERVRQYRARKKAEMLEHRMERGELQSAMPGVTFLPLTNRWRALAPPRGQTAADHAVMLGDDFRTRDAAEQAMLSYFAGTAYVDTHPVEPPTTPEALRARQQRVTSTANTFADLHAALAYDPSTGAIYWREGARKGLRADRPYRHNTGRVVAHRGHYYPAHRLAWALTNDYWPRRGLTWRNGDQNDNRLVNLYLKPQGVPL